MSIRPSKLPLLMKCPNARHEPEIKVAVAGDNDMANLGSAVHECASCFLLHVVVLFDVLVCQIGVAVVAGPSLCGVRAR